MRQLLPEQQHHANSDRGIGDIEGRPVPASDMEIQEIDYGAEAQPVDDVAERPAEHQRQRGRHQAFRCMVADHDDQPGGNGQREDDEKPFLPAAGPGEKAEGGTAVEDQHEIEEARDRQAFAEMKAGQHPKLAGLIERNDQRSKTEPGFRFRQSHVARRNRRDCSRSARIVRDVRRHGRAGRHLRASASNARIWRGDWASLQSPPRRRRLFAG